MRWCLGFRVIFVENVGFCDIKMRWFLLASITCRVGCLDSLFIDLFSGKCRTVVQHLARQKLSSVGRIQASSEFPLSQQVIAFQSASVHTASSNVQSVTRSIFGDTIDETHRKDGGIGNLSSDNVTPGNPPRVKQIISGSPSSAKQSRKNVAEPQNGGSSDSWSTVPGGRPPLTADEEAEYALHVQVLYYFGSQLACGLGSDHILDNLSHT